MQISRVARTHRERKELYIKALEQEVLRLKESYSHVTRQRDDVAEENRQLRELLQQHGIATQGIEARDATFRGTDHNTTSTPSLSTSYAESGAGSQGFGSPVATLNQYNQSQTQGGPPVRQTGVDYDQVGIDFVLTYDQSPYLSPPHR